MLTCPQCGHANTAQSNFCSQCGTPLAGGGGDVTRVIPVVADDVAPGELSAADQATVESLPAHSAVLIVRRGATDGGRFLLDAPETIAGRHVNADIFLDDITVSRHHARFTLVDGILTVADMGSLNGTYVNRRLIESPTVLHDGDEVQIGKFRMVSYLGRRG